MKGHRTLWLLLFFTCLASVFGEGLPLQVVDKDLDIPLEGVRITDTATGMQIYTDFAGEAVLPLERPGGRLILVAELIGYEDKKVLVKDFDSLLVVEMSMEGVLEGEELVIEAEVVGETDEEVGVSVVIEKEVIQTAAKMGIIEDVLTAVKLLPGVSYSGSFGTDLSVRGSDPDGLTAVMDGFLVKYPYHFGGAFSIFNPNIVESVKFSAGIFSAKYGQATSGILDVLTITPNDGFKFHSVVSTSTLEAFVQLPFGRKQDFGIFAGARLTNYDLALKWVGLIGDWVDSAILKEMLSAISRAPYIYDFYLKTNYRPNDRFEWYINGFWGNDGVGSAYSDLDLDTTFDTDTDIAYDFDFKYYNTDIFANTGVRLLLGDNALLHVLAGYEYLKSDIDAYIREFGNRFYTDAFLAEYGYLLDPGTESFFVSTESTFQNYVLRHGVQARGDMDLTIGERFLLQFGLGGYLDFTDNTGAGELWTITYDDGLPVYKNVTYESTAEDNRILNSFLYISTTSTLIPDRLSMDLGLRLDHSYLFGADDFDLNTYPVPGPRLSITITPPWEGRFFLDHTFSVGTGLFSKTPFDSDEITADMGLEDFEVAIPKTLMALAGWETHMPLGFRFKLEGYYKYIFDRFYTNDIIDEDTGVQETIIHNDGIGHAGGFDFILDKKTSRYVDGLLSYSFIYARYFEPEADGTDSADTPREQWYFPSFHRYHTLNFLLNIKPTSNFTFTTLLSFGTGSPNTEYGEREMFLGYIENPDGSTSLAEMYTRDSYYSDVLRTNISLPVDIKFTFHNYIKKTKLRWEVYIAVEDVLAPLLYYLLPDDDVNTSMWSGEDLEAPTAVFLIPLPSIGFQLTY